MKYFIEKNPTSNLPSSSLSNLHYDSWRNWCPVVQRTSLTWCIIILPRSVCHIPPLTALLKLSQYFQLWLITCPDLQISDMACLDPLDWPSQVEVVCMHTLDIWKNKKILLFPFILKRNSQIGAAWSCSHIPNYQTFIRCFVICEINFNMAISHQSVRYSDI